jgi:hypothetical protein
MIFIGTGGSMRKLVLTLVALIAVVTFIRAYDVSSFSSVETGEHQKPPVKASLER